ncbi:MAG TPA: valine--tRNA ligase [Actinomycetota bacterium]|nr:valine--tRNA ligase [Actinomycetota bacterium]
MSDLAKVYDPKGVESRWYDYWRGRGLFAGATGAPGRQLSIVIPPPNITGALHMGHALNGTLQDIVARRARMQGRPTMWLPGTDHAAIATQNVLERRLAEEGISRQEMGREAFEARFWEWKQEYEARILDQFAKLGCSLDWDRTRFTMDAGLSHAVRTVFVRLYEEGRIYRGTRIINWCPRCVSALSDIEVKHFDRDGELVTLRYPLSDGSGHITVATTRVETMLGDSGVAVSPDDDRYRHLIGSTVRLPLMDRDIPIVADESVDAEFGTGAVKVTPAHDPNDFDIGQRHGLEQINIFDERAQVNENGGRFAGLDRFEARKTVLEALRERGLVEAEERPYLHSVGHCDRCDSIIEPWLSEQWFVAMKELAAPAVEAVTSGRIRIIPAQPFEKQYLDWMTNIRDWCISRQLWLGHRIPVWYCASGHTFASMEEAPVACAECGGSDIEQDPDVLDTWFSSQLWPFSTLGWPEETDDLRYWYPTTVLVTAYEILYLWVARMIVAGLHFMGEVPFHEVLIHGIVRDFEGKKMSKSKGNTIDPMDLSDRYGTDALRFSLARSAIPGQDTNVAEEWIEGDRRFANKLWNASRFVLSNLGEQPPEGLPAEPALPEAWILSRLAQTVRAADAAMDSYEFAEAARSIYQFVWSEFCDWYLEMAKLGLRDESTAPAVRSVLHHVLDTTLRLLHPLMPFVTEEIWQRLPGRGDDESIMTASWPADERMHLDPDAEQRMVLLQELVVEIRRFRHEHSVAPRTKIDAVVVAPAAHAQTIQLHSQELRALAGLEELTLAEASPGTGWSRIVVGQAEVYLPLTAVADPAAERGRLTKSIFDLQAQADRANAKLDSPGFMDRAPSDVVDKVRGQLAEAQARIEKLRAQLEQLPDG